EGSLEHVEVFRMGSVGTSIMEDLDTYPAIAARPPPTLSTAKSPYSLEAEFVEATERGQAGRSEGSLEHVEVFRMGSVGTSIMEDLDTYPAIAARPPPTLSTAKSRKSRRTSSSAAGAGFCGTQ
uniref:hypothetical protein n=1 Tax=Microbacterium sp. BF1 TaxID=2821146 RepID=UPI001C4E1FD6